MHQVHQDIISRCKWYHIETHTRQWPYVWCQVQIKIRFHHSYVANKRPTHTFDKDSVDACFYMDSVDACTYIKT